MNSKIYIEEFSQLVSFMFGEDVFEDFGDMINGLSHYIDQSDQDDLRLCVVEIDALLSRYPEDNDLYKVVTGPGLGAVQLPSPSELRGVLEEARDNIKTFLN